MISQGLERRVAVIGAGLAGIAAALRLAEAGCRPVVIETSRRLGGRATSFADPQTGELIDNCQHVVLGCCTNLIDLYDRLGVLERFQWHRTLYWTHAQGRVEEMRASWWPAPFHLARSVRRMAMFDGAERRHLRRAMWRIIRLGPAGRQRWRDRTFAEFLEECRQPPELVTKFWNVIVTSACNLGVERVGAAYALQVFQEGFLAHRFSYTMGLATVPLAALYEPAREAIERAGGEVRLGMSARAIAFDGRRATGVVTGEGTVEAAAVLSAVPFDRLDRLASETMKRADVRLRGLDRLEVCPILGVHLWFDQPIMEHPHLVLAGCGVQWLFDKGEDAEGLRHVHAVISGADAWMALPEPEIVERVMADVYRALPRARGLRPLRVRAIREKRATFAATPGAEAHRPPAGPAFAAGPGIENLYLAGDWCDTGWPATMEGAVRSGYAAAAAITGTGGVVEDVPPGLLSRWLGL